MRDSSGDSADDWLLAGLNDGDEDAWRRLIDRYQGRLTAMARSRLPASTAADDLVQETFVAFLESMGNFRGQCSLETYLFTILRRRLADHYRAGRRNYFDHPIDDDAIAVGGTDALDDLDRIERGDRLTAQLAAAIAEVTDRWRRNHELVELQVAEALFFAAMKNRDIAESLPLNATQIADRKRRLIARVRERIQWDPRDAPETGSLDGEVITRAWRLMRPSCPKRSVLGKFTMDVLPPDWMNHVRFHTELIGCEFCRASLKDFAGEGGDVTRCESNDLFRSTINFLPRPS